MTTHMQYLNQLAYLCLLTVYWNWICVSCNSNLLSFSWLCCGQKHFATSKFGICFQYLTVLLWFSSVTLMVKEVSGMQHDDQIAVFWFVTDFSNPNHIPTFRYDFLVLSWLVRVHFLFGITLCNDDCPACLNPYCVGKHASKWHKEDIKSDLQWTIVYNAMLDILPLSYDVYHHMSYTT